MRQDFLLFNDFFYALGNLDGFFLRNPTGVHAKPLFFMIPCDTNEIVRFVFRMFCFNHDGLVSVDVYIRNDSTLNTTNLCGFGIHFTEADNLHARFGCILNADSRQHNSSMSFRSLGADTMGSILPAIAQARQRRRCHLPPDSSAFLPFPSQCE